MTANESGRPSGLPQALGAYGIWGFIPLYFMLLSHVPPFEFVGWRVIFTLPVCLAVILIGRKGKDLRRAIGNPRVLGLLTASAFVIGGNWLIFIAAINSGHVFAVSLGYYINPLVNVLAGTLFLGERLSSRQWIAVLIAAAGVSLLAWGAPEALGISLALAISFATYGLLRKFAPVASLPGLTIESTILLLPAVGIVLWHAASPAGQSMGQDIATDLLIAASGVVTATPLLLFAVAARRMDYSALGFVQFLAPTLQFLVGLLVFHEPLKPVQLACFLTIWTAIAIFSWDLLARRRKRQGSS